MRAYFKITGSIATLLALSACGAKVSGSSSKPANTQTSNATSGTNNVIAFSPATGVYNAMPATITISFSNSSIDSVTGSTSSNYTLVCGGTPVVASSVTPVAGLSSVTASIPGMFGLVEGEVCTFNVSSGVKDSNGNAVGGTHSVNYTYSASGAAPVNNGTTTGTGTSWNESATTTYTSQIGNPVANVFHGVGAAGAVMSGINVNGTSYVDGISGLWSNGFATTNASAGPVQGNTTQTFTALTCPAGYRMTGVTGRSGSYIDAIGIICKTEDQSQTFTSAVFGGAGGNAYTLSCGAGQFVTELAGTSGSYLDALYLGCR